MHKYAAVAGNKFFEENKKAVESCVAFLEGKLDAHRLIPGMDWRDAMPVYIGKCLLANQMLLADMYELLGNRASNLVKENVNRLFYLKRFRLVCRRRSLGWQRAKAGSSL